VSDFRTAAAAALVGPLVLAAAAIAAHAAPSVSGRPGAPAPSKTALLLFVTPTGAPGGSGARAAADDAALAELRGVPGLSLGLLSATEGVFRAEQLLLDISAGDRVEYASYHPSFPPPLVLRRVGAGGVFAGWAAVLARAHAAPQLISPGLLAGSVPGGAAYAGVQGQSAIDAVAAADPGGRVAAWSNGPAATLPARISGLLSAHRLVVADLPGGTAGSRQLHAIVATRPASELVMVVQRAPDREQALLAIGIAGLGADRELTSQTTRQRGLVASIDLPVSILDQLGRPVPSAMRGAAIHTDRSVDAASLRALRERLLVVAGRRMPTLLWLAIVSASLMLLGAAVGRGRAAARVAALAWLWLPTATLLPATSAPSKAAEIVVIIAASLLLALITERLVPWPRAPALPAVVAIAALTVDALAGTQLLIRSILGPNPAFGARFYGIGNELKSGLAVLAFGGVAAALSRADPRRGAPRRPALAMAGAGIVLAVIEGSARIGAGVGGVVLVSAGAAVATAWLLPGGLNRRRLGLVALAPLVGLVGLAVLDLLFAHGSGHFTGSVLHARSAEDLRDLLVRRYTDAWDASKDGLMPEALLVCLLAIAAGLYWRRWLLAPVRALGADTAELWSAALAGGLTAGVVGIFVEDSGTLLLVVAVAALAALVTYLRAAPVSPHNGSKSATRRNLRSGAPRPPRVGVRESASESTRG